MTEKRFECVGSSLYDNTKDVTEQCIGNFESVFECKKICELLNKQEEIIKKQSNKIGKLKLQIMLLSKKIK